VRAAAAIAGVVRHSLEAEPLVSDSLIRVCSRPSWLQQLIETLPTEDE